MEENNKWKYKAILCDAPWSRNQQSGKNNIRGAESHYPLMKLEDIKAMPVADLCQENAHLWLWVPNGLIEDGLEVIKAWGFTYRNSFYWIKPGLGLGNWLRNASETCLFATHGNAPVKFRGQPNWCFAPRQEHSHKPEEMFPIIERLSDGPYLELFARRKGRSGWDYWGNEVASDIVVPGYPVPKYSDKVTKRGEAE